MTHEYTLLVGGVVQTGTGMAEVSALAYADDTVLAVGSDAEVRAVSRGDSRVVELMGQRILPVDGIVLEPGASASFDILGPDGRRTAAVREGRVIEGRQLLRR